MRNVCESGRAVVEIRWLDVATVVQEEWGALETLLDADERARAARFRFERDRHSYIAAHALMRCMLSGRIERAPADWRFSIGDKGKPEAVMAPGEPRLRVNLSHTRGMAVVALTAGHDVGIDVEWRNRALGPEVVDRFFAPAEVAALKAMPQERFDDGFFAFWTLKEAFIKAIGLGLSMPLDAFAFDLEDLTIAFAPGHEKPGPWLFRRFEPKPDYAMALALRHPEPASVSVSVSSAEARWMLDTYVSGASGGAVGGSISRR